MRRLAVISGKYGGFRAMLPMLRLFDADHAWDMTVYLMDQHLWPDRGQTALEARQLVKEVRIVGSARTPRETSLFRAFSKVAEEWRRGQPDMVIVYGDRLDALLGAALAHESGIPVAHLQAGDRTGGTDDTRRWAISAISRWLFCSTQQARFRIHDHGMGGWSDQKIHVVGDHHIDAVMEIARQPLRPPGIVLRRPYYVVHMHPDTRATEEENKKVCKELWDALGEAAQWGLEADAVVIPPCNDRMHEVVSASTPGWAIRHMKHFALEQYVPLLEGSLGLWGNSSAILLDAPALCVPTRLFGNRQRGRDTGPFGNGTAGRQTYDILH